MTGSNIIRNLRSHFSDDGVFIELRDLIESFFCFIVSIECPVRACQRHGIDVGGVGETRITREGKNQADDYLQSITAGLRFDPVTPSFGAQFPTYY